MIQFVEDILRKCCDTKSSKPKLLSIKPINDEIFINTLQKSYYQAELQGYLTIEQIFVSVHLNWTNFVKVKMSSFLNTSLIFNIGPKYFCLKGGPKNAKISKFGILTNFLIRNFQHDAK